jgi:hypothetical protein
VLTRASSWFRASVVATVAALSILTHQAAPAHAEIIFNGVCLLNLQFSFPSTQPTVTGPASPYTFGTTPGSSCTMDNLEPTAGVGFWGSAAAGQGGITNARCGVLAGNGPFNQTWGGSLPSVGDGTHVVVGTWLHATMVVSALPTEPIRMTGVVELVPTDVVDTLTKLQTCLNGGDVNQIFMKGVEVFNDPTLPGA